MVQIRFYSNNYTAGIIFYLEFNEWTGSFIRIVFIEPRKKFCLNDPRTNGLNKTDNQKLIKLSKKYIFKMQTVMKSHGGSDVAVGVTQLLSQTLCQGSHGELGAAVEMCISAVNHAMSAHAATQEHE